MEMVTWDIVDVDTRSPFDTVTLYFVPTVGSILSIGSSDYEIITVTDDEYHKEIDVKHIIVAE